MARVWAEIEALGLSKAEKRLVEACKAGRECVLGLERPQGPSNDLNIRAEVLRYLILGGCDGCRVHELGVRLVGAWVKGALDLSFATAKGQTSLERCGFESQVVCLQTRLELLNLGGSALPGLNLQGAQFTGNVFLRNGFVAGGEVSLSGAVIGGQLDCTKGQFQNAGGHALNAQGARVTGGVFLRDGFVAKGEVRLSGAEIGGQLECTKGQFQNAGGDALNAQGAQVTGDVFLRDGFQAKGEVSLSGAVIGGQLACMEGRFENAGGDALNAQGAQVTGGVFLSDGFVAEGEVRLLGAVIGGSLDCANGQFQNAGGQALNAEGAQVTGDVFLSDGFVAEGEVSLSGAVIGGQLDCTKGQFQNAGGDALRAQRMRVVQVFFWRQVTVKAGAINLASAHVGDLADDLDSWPESGRNYLNGFTYDTIGGEFTDVDSRLKWLARGDTWNGEFHPQPYTHLAKVYRSMGHDAAARKVLIERNRLLAAYQRNALRAGPEEATYKDVVVGWDWFKDFGLRTLVGYGYDPFRSVKWLVLLWFTATWLAAAAWHEGSMVPNSDVILTSSGWQSYEGDRWAGANWSSRGAPGQDWETFNRYAWGADLVIPILDLGQTEAWAPSTERGPWGRCLWWGRWVLIAAGWIVAGLFAAAITGIIRREED